MKEPAASAPPTFVSVVRVSPVDPVDRVRVAYAGELATVPHRSLVTIDGAGPFVRLDLFQECIKC